MASAFDLAPVIRKIADHLKSSGFVESAGIGEPFSPPEDLHGAVFYGPEWTTYETTLSAPREERQIMIRVYQRAFVEDIETAELRIGRIASEVYRTLFQDFTFDQDEVTMGSPTRFRTSFGYQEIGREAGGAAVMYRFVDFLVPLLIDDSFSFAT